EQVIAQVRSEESCASRDEDRGPTGADRRYGVLTNLSSNNRPSFSFGFTLLSTPLAVRYRWLLPPSVPGANAMPEADTIPRPEMSIFWTRPPLSVVSRMNVWRLLTMNRCLPLTATSSAVVNPYLWVPKLFTMSSRVPNLLSLPRWILYTRRLVESDTISMGLRPPRQARPSGSKEPKRCVCRAVMTASSRVPSFLSFPRPTRKTRSRSSSVTKRAWSFPSHARSSGSCVNFLNVPVASSRPPRFATKRFLPFHREGISSTSESEMSSFFVFGLYVRPIGSGLWVGQLEVSVTRTTEAF